MWASKGYRRHPLCPPPEYLLREQWRNKLNPGQLIMSYKLSFQSKNALPALTANQRQNAPMLFSIANPHSFAGSLISCFAFSSVQSLRSMRMVRHLNAWKLYVQVGLLRLHRDTQVVAPTRSGQRTK